MMKTENVHIEYKHKLAFMPFTGASFINDSLLQSMLHVNHQRASVRGNVPLERNPARTKAYFDLSRHNFSF